MRPGPGAVKNAKKKPVVARDDNGPAGKPKSASQKSDANDGPASKFMMKQSGRYYPNESRQTRYNYS